MNCFSDPPFSSFIFSLFVKDTDKQPSDDGTGTVVTNDGVVSFKQTAKGYRCSDDLLGMFPASLRIPTSWSKRTYQEDPDACVVSARGKSARRRVTFSARSVASSIVWTTRREAAALTRFVSTLT